MKSEESDIHLNKERKGMKTLKGESHTETVHRKEEKKREREREFALEEQ